MPATQQNCFLGCGFPSASISMCLVWRNLSSINFLQANVTVYYDGWWDAAVNIECKLHVKVLSLLALQFTVASWKTFYRYNSSSRREQDHSTTGPLALNISLFPGPTQLSITCRLCCRLCGTSQLWQWDVSFSPWPRHARVGMLACQVFGSTPTASEWMASCPSWGKDGYIHTGAWNSCVN